MTSEPPQYDAGTITLITGREVVRKRPAFFLGCLDPHRLIRCAVDGLLDHYHHLQQPVVRIAVHVADDGSVRVTSESRRADLGRGHEHLQLLQRELQLLHVGLQGVFMLNALSDRLEAAVQVEPTRQHCCTFEQGLLRQEEMQEQAGAASADLRLVFWPDYTLLDPGPLDLARSLDEVHSFAESNPDVTIKVTGGHLGAENAK